jgi:hypothetical protein
MHTAAKKREWDGQTVDSNAAEHHECDDRLDSKGQVIILVDWRVVGLRELLRCQCGDINSP